MDLNFHHRTITVTSPAFKSSEWGTPYFLFHKIQGTENLNELFEYTVICRTQDEYGNGILENYISKAMAQAGGSPGSNLDLKTAIGAHLTVAIELDGKIDSVLSAFGENIERSAGGILDAASGKGTRYINGLITDASYIGTQGRHAMYQFTIRNWMYLLTRSSDYKVWQQMSIPDILKDIFNRLPFRVEYRLNETYPVLDYQVQYGETHYGFAKRLMEEAGINYFVDHQKDGHTVVLTDTLSGFKPMDSVAYSTCFVYPPDLKLQEEYISRFEPLQQHVSGQIRLNDYQFKSPTADQTSLSHQPWETAHNALEVYEWKQGDYISPAEGGDHKSRLYMEGIRQHGHRATAQGHLRGIQSGHSLKILNHPNEESNRSWIVLGTTFEASETSQETNSQSQFTVNVHFTLQPDNEPIRPDRITPKPPAHSQTATVVGPANQEVWVDQYGRIKVQFHWDRYGNKDENSSCWVRVSSPWQGTNFGGVQHPRIGQEVIINFLNNDADMPYVSGRLSNPDHMPLWDLPTQHALSGFKSKELHGAQNNHLIMDDSHQQVQVQLTSDHQLSQLNLGYITRIPDTAGRKDYRGQGFELRTDGHAAIRAAKGMMLSTYTRASGSSHIKDLSEIIGVLKSAQSQHKSFAELAIEHKADERAIDTTAQKDLLKQNHDISGEAQGKAASDADKFPELQQPHLVLGSPAGIQLATPKSLHIATNEHTAITAGQDLSMSVGKRLIASVAKGISLFSQSLGIKAIAAKGKIEIQAQSDGIDIIAQKVLKFISAQESIEIAAKKSILLNGGGSYIRIDASGIEQGTLGNWKAWAGSHDMPGPKSLPMIERPEPLRVYSNRLDVYDAFLGNEFGEVNYQAIYPDGKVQEGTLDKDGRTARIVSKQKEDLKVLVGGDTWTFILNKSEYAPTKPVELEFMDLLEKPIVGLKFKIEDNGGVVHEGVTDGQGIAKFTYTGDNAIVLFLEKLATKEMKPLCFINHRFIRKMILVSPKILTTLELEPEDAAAGQYRRGTYEVQAGDTLTSIAKKYGVSENDLLDHNEFMGESILDINEGDTIHVPPITQRIKWA
jgi:type VI secretion system secreted protein VgrG